MYLPEEQLTTLEKHVADSDGDSNHEQPEGETESEENEERSSMASFQKIYSKFNKVQDKLTDRMWQADNPLIQLLLYNSNSTCKPTGNCRKMLRNIMDPLFYIMLYKMVIIPWSQLLLMLVLI